MCISRSTIDIFRIDFNSQGVKSARLNCRCAIRGKAYRISFLLKSSLNFIVIAINYQQDKNDDGSLQNEEGDREFVGCSLKTIFINNRRHLQEFPVLSREKVKQFSRSNILALEPNPVTPHIFALGLSSESSPAVILIDADQSHILAIVTHY